MNIGIMLAAGEATRLPYKPLLPLRDGHSIAIESGLELLYRSCKRVIVVVRKDSLIPTILAKRRWHGLEYCEQRESGVVNAIASARQHMLLSSTDLSRAVAHITFCDNVFGDEVIPRVNVPTASVRSSENFELDRYDVVARQWVYRTEVHHLYALAGWYVLPGTSLPTWSDESSIDMLNRLSATATKVDLPWYDIGTVDSYARYMNALHLTNHT